MRDILKFLFFTCFFFLPLFLVGQNRPVYSPERSVYYQEQASAYDYKQPELALRYADSVELSGHALKDSTLLYSAYKLKGDINRHQGALTEGLFFLKKALDLGRQHNDTLLIVKAHNNLGAVYFDRGEYDKALRSFAQARLMGDKVLDPAQKATVLGNMGHLYDELGQASEALLFYKQALEIQEKVANKKGLALLHNNLGKLYFRQQEKENALQHYRLARKLNEEIGEENGIAEALSGISMVYLKENPEISIEYLGIAQKLYRKNNNIKGLYQLNKQAGETYVALEDYQHAHIHFERALDFADSLANPFYRGQLLLKIAELYEQQRNYEQAAQYYKQYVEVEKRVYNKELIQNIAHTKADYELDQKNDKIKNLEQEAAETVDELEFRNYMLVFVLLLSFLTILFGFFFGLKYRSARRANNLLKARNQLISSQKSEIESQHQLIRHKNEELEAVRKQNEEFNAELLSIKERLEEKVNHRTRELEEIYIKLSFHINNTPLAILEWNNKLELMHWPKQAESIFGYTAEEVLGLQMDEVPFVMPDDRPEVLKTVEQLSRGEISRHYITKQHLDRYGNIKYVEWSYSALLNEKGALESVLAIANDVTLRERTYRDLSSANQELDTFLYKSSHDLRGPIARMQGIINLGLMETADENARMYFNMLNKVTDELNNLLLRLLMVHNINQHESEPEEIHFHAYIDTLVGNYTGRRSSTTKVEIRNNVPESLIVSADKVLLDIILVNLLENGLMFADNFNPVIELDAVYLPSGKYIIMVSDNGMGIPEQFREKIFDMFFQGSTRSTGPGLGLYMVRKATKKMGGDIRLTSENGQTVFEISLPAAKAKQSREIKVLN